MLRHIASERYWLILGCETGVFCVAEATRHAHGCGWNLVLHDHPFATLYHVHLVMGEVL